jgi:hypothetical protein
MRGDYWMEFKNRFNIKRIIEVYGATEGVGALSNLKGVPGMIGKLKTAGVRMGEVAQYDPETEDFVRDEKGFIKKCKRAKTDVPPPSAPPTLSRDTRTTKKATGDKIIEMRSSPETVFYQRPIYSGFMKRIMCRSWTVSGTTFKWKGEVVETNESSRTQSVRRHRGQQRCRSYREKHEGRCGDVALTLLP